MSSINTIQKFKDDLLASTSDSNKFLPFLFDKSVSFFAKPETMNVGIKRLIKNDFSFEKSGQEVIDRKNLRSFYLEKNDGEAGQGLLGELRDLAKKESHGTRK